MQRRYGQVRCTVQNLVEIVALLISGAALRKCRRVDKKMHRRSAMIALLSDTALVTSFRPGALPRRFGIPLRRDQASDNLAVPLNFNLLAAFDQIDKAGQILSEFGQRYSLHAQ